MSNKPLPKDAYRHLLDLLAAADKKVGPTRSPKKVVEGMNKLMEDYDRQEEERIKAFLKTYTDLQK